EAQVIVAHGLDANGSDQHQLTPMVDAVEANMGRKADEVSADAGYCSDANLAPGRAKHAAEGEGGGARIAAMREKIKAGGHATPYRLRKPLLLGPRDPRPRSQRAEQIRNRQAAQHRTHLRPTPARSSLTPRSIHWRTI